MITATTQIADERRLYETIGKHHRDALKREQIALARANRPSGIGAFMARMREEVGGALSSMQLREVTPAPAPQAAPGQVQGETSSGGTM